jgi:hypothetical protein
MNYEAHPKARVKRKSIEPPPAEEKYDRVNYELVPAV